MGTPFMYIMYLFDVSVSLVFYRLFTCGYPPHLVVNTIAPAFNLSLPHILFFAFSVLSVQSVCARASLEINLIWNNPLWCGERKKTKTT